jgi:glycosyltransferase involved in cell wall biosynthesis
VTAVAIVAGSDPREPVTGHRTYVLAHVLAARAAGFEPHVFVVAERDGVEEAEFGVVHLVRSPVRPLYTLMAPAHQPFLARGIEAALRDGPGPCLIHSFGAWAGVGVAASRRLTRRGVESVAIATAYTTLAHEIRAKVAGLDRRHGVRQRVRFATIERWTRAVASPHERRGYSGSRLVLCNYESVRRLVGELCGPSVAPRVVPYAAPAAFRDAEVGERVLAAVPESVRALEPAGAPLIVSVSRHDPRKGVDRLLDALSALAAAGVPFRACLVGDGSLLPAHRRMRRELGLERSVAIPGFVPDVFEYLRCADIFVLPSIEEGSGSVALQEALQAGVAVVASDCDGIPEDLVHERDGLLVPAGDSPALAAALSALLRDAALRQRLARRAREVYRERFTAARFQASLAGVYCELGFEPR